MGNSNKLPLEAWVPGGRLYDEFQPEHFTSIAVRDRWAAVVDAKGNLTLYEVEPISSKMKCRSVTFLNDAIFDVLEEEIEPTVQLTISGLSLEEERLSIYLQIESYLVKLQVWEEQLSWSWMVSTSDWRLTATDGRGTYLFALEDREEIHTLTPQGDERTLYVESDPRFTLRTTPSRQEFGIDQMFFLSPDKKKLAFYRLDQSEVTTFPIVAAPDGKEMPSCKMERYPMAGTHTPERVEVAVLDMTTGRVTHLERYGEICYWVGLTWSPLSDRLYCFAVDRRQQSSRLLRFDVTSGKCEGEILCEGNSKYVEQQHSLYFIDADRFLFQTRSYSGYNHIYLFDLKINTLNQITQGNWEVTSLLGYSSERDAVLYLATKNSPMNRDFFATRLSDGETFSLSPQIGTHQIFMDEAVSLYVDLFQSVSEPCVTTLGSLACYGDTHVLLRSRNPYEGYDLPEREVGILPKADPSDDDLYYRIVKPKNIKPGDRLPVVFYVYGGPHVQLITNTWGSGTKGFEEMMADAGCVVFYIDPHGSDNRGFDFESEIRDDINGPQMRDYKYALNWLFLTHDYVDRNRVAIYGWSFGGFMTLTMLLRSGFPFKVGVAGGAVVSWRYYETMYTERYMSLDEKGETSGDHFDRSDMTRYVANLKAPLMMIHCCEDPVVLPLQLNYLLSELNKCDGGVNGLVSCYLYPGHQHNVRGPQRVNLMEKVKDMIFKYL